MNCLPRFMAANMSTKMTAKLFTIQLKSVLISQSNTTGHRFAANIANKGFNCRAVIRQTQLTTSYGSPKIQANNKIILPKNIVLRHCSPSTSYALSLDTGFSESMPMTTTRRPLTIIFSWMLAKDKHVEKYRQLWYKRGFDVLTVRTSPFDLLVPPLGGQVVAKNLAQTLSQLNAQYNEIVIHAFSVGGYQFGLTLNELIRSQQNQHILDSIKGIVIDSMVFTEDCAPGLSRAVTLNPVVQPMIESTIHVFLKLFKNTVKYYDTAYYMIANPVVKYSGLFFYSKDDVVSSIEQNHRVMNNWIKLGHRVRSKCWDTSTHVLHYRDHKSDYEQELDDFLKNLKLRNSKI